MYNTDAHILKQICHLIKQITSRYKLEDEDIFKIAEAIIVLMTLVKKIEKS